MKNQYFAFICIFIPKALFWNEVKDYERQRTFVRPDTEGVILERSEGSRAKIILETVAERIVVPNPPTRDWIEK